jgi:hypothetical protein
MTTVAQLSTILQSLFTTTADRLAREVRLIRRRRKLTGASFAQALVFGWMDNPNATLDQLAQATAYGGQPLTPQALAERFTDDAATFLHRLLTHALDQVVAAQPAAPALLRRFAGVYIQDSTQLLLPAALAQRWPGCGAGTPEAASAAAIKVQLRYEVSSGRFERLALQPGRQADADFGSGSLPAGALRLADLGYFDLDVLSAYDRERVFFISRLQARSRLFDAAGRKWTLAAFLAASGGDRVDARVRLGVRHRLGVRLVAFRAPPAVVARRQQRARQKARDNGAAVSPEALAVCGWTVLISNVPPTTLSAAEVWVLYRVRWQIELVFKRWKSDSRLSASRSRQPARVLCEVYAKLLGVVVEQWLLLVSGGGFGERSVRRAARAVRGVALQLVSALGRRRAMRQVLELLRRLLAATGRINRRRRRPSTYQTLLNPDEHGLT